MSDAHSDSGDEVSNTDSNSETSSVTQENGWKIVKYKHRKFASKYADKETMLYPRCSKMGCFTVLPFPTSDSMYSVYDETKNYPYCSYYCMMTS